MHNTIPATIAIIGAGPVGLAAAAHIIERGMTPLIFEAASEVGANVRDWGHVRMFSPWQYTVDAVSVRLLEQSGWRMPNPDALPTGDELLNDYLHPLADLPQIRDALHTDARVVAISRAAIDKMKDRGREQAPYSIHVEHSDGSEARYRADAVIDASGTWSQPNPLGANGLPALGEKRHRERIVYGIPDVQGAQRSRYAGRRIAVVGAGHSAINALLSLATLAESAPDTRAIWVLRGNNLAKIYGGQENDALEARGALGSRIQSLVDSGRVRVVQSFRVQAVTTNPDGALCLQGTTPDGPQQIEIDEIIAATGSRPNLEMVRELRLDLDPAVESTRTLAPMIDPNLHSCGTVPPHGEAQLRHPERGFYIVGMKSYGRAPTFLLATGYEQVRSVVAYLAGDEAAARDVQLNLPETGVCNTDFADAGDACCSPAEKSTVAVDTCCDPVAESVTISLDSLFVNNG